MQNPQEYIESGILEQYALGALDSAERAEVEHRAAQSDDIQAELTRIEHALEAYAQAHAVPPPAALRERVLSRVRARIAQPPPTADSSLRADVDALARTHQQLTANGQSAAAATAAPAPATRSLWAVAASVALLLSLGGNAWLYQHWQRTRHNLLALESEQARVAAATRTTERTLGTLRRENTVLRDEGYRAVALAGTPNFPAAHARVLFNAASRKVFLDVKTLPALAEGKQYQLWALDKGQPVDAGMLAAATAAGDSLQQMKDIASAQAFAMTVEPAGGSANPTMSTMTVIGNI